MSKGCIDLFNGYYQKYFSYYNLFEYMKSITQKPKSIQLIVHGLTRREFVVYTSKMNVNEFKFQVGIVNIDHWYKRLLLFLFVSCQSERVIISTYHINELDG